MDCFVSYGAVGSSDVEKNNSHLHTVATKLIKLMSSKADNMQDMPTHYAALEWIVGFGEYMFDGNMECFKKNDQVFGMGNYEASVCDGAATQEDCWKELSEFKRFVDAVDRVKSQGAVKNKGKE